MFQKKQRNEHRISDISFQRGYLECRCTWRAEPDSPAGLALQYQGHRREVGLMATTTSEMGGSAETVSIYTIRRTRRHK